MLRCEKKTYAKPFTATTTGTPNLLAFSICLMRLLQPCSTSVRFCRWENKCRIIIRLNAKSFCEIYYKANIKYSLSRTYLDVVMRLSNHT